MGHWHTLYLVFRDGVFVDACLSYSEASRLTPYEPGHKWEIRRRQAEDY